MRRVRHQRRSLPAYSKLPPVRRHRLPQAISCDCPAKWHRFLHNSHNYYLQYKYPHIRTNLLSSLDPAHADINPIIIKYFDDYVSEVEAHFHYEESTVFPYVKSLSEGKHDSSYNISIFSRRHDHQVESRLAELKNIILRYYSTSVPYRMYDVLVDLYNCEEDLKQHAHIEDHILVPLITRLESAK